MKNLRSNAGPFSERPFYKDGEIEQICSDALRETGLYPSELQPIRIERFIGKRFGVTPEYARLPEGVLGYTEFGKSGVAAIYVDSLLSEEGTQAAERRVTSTLAHEAGHGLLHAHLFVLQPPSPGLFGHSPDCTGSKILCRDEVGSSSRRLGEGYDGRWWEFQANQAMSALLLPKPLVERCVEPLLVSRGFMGRGTLEDARRTEAIRLIAETFDVNPVVAKIRLAGMYPEGDRQLAL